MRTGFLITFLAFIICGCNKSQSIPVEPPAPEMNTINFNNAVAGQQQSKSVDLNGDGIRDITFFFQIVGDPLLQADKYQFYVSGAFDTDFPVDVNEEIPALQNGNIISATAYPQHEWYNASAILLAQKIVTATQPPYWTGTWKDRSHTYFPFRIHKDGKLFYGWFEISFDMAAEKIVLHKAAVAKVAATPVTAGQ